MSYTLPKGVFDILPIDPDPKMQWRNSDRWHYVISQIQELVEIYGFKQISTPIFEKTDLFHRGIGTGTDIVSKEIYTFKDKGDRSLALRPEGTAPVMRAFIEKKLHLQNNIHKLYYIGPMFRYERQQAGRYRQHHQFGAELIGSKNPEADVEVIDLLYTLYTRLGLKNLTVLLNSVGSTDTLKTFRTVLKEYLHPHLDQLSQDSQIRFEKNPLRILDSKADEDQKWIQKAPSILDFLSDEDKDHFENVKSLLTLLKIPYQIENKLVRGLDYYNRTVFEITAGELGAQNAIGAGGRYDGLIKTLGGPDIPSVGFASGIERILQTMGGQKAFFPPPQCPQLFLIPLDEKALHQALLLLKELRHQNICVEMDVSQGKLKNSMKYADKIGAEFVTVIGEDELKKQTLLLKHMQTGSTKESPLDTTQIIKHIQN